MAQTGEFPVLLFLIPPRSARDTLWSWWMLLAVPRPAVTKMKPSLLPEQVKAVMRLLFKSVTGGAAEGCRLFLQQSVRLNNGVTARTRIRWPRRYS